ncbi:MAG TPA: plastocyanin/azurin family copper-binding protein [Solirubrobacterales bacterium]|nr:plastocyanin/azurin family copper-binding protein [Solirubrobacterales bacterium]
MSNETLFYICGIALAVSAVLVSFAGLRIKSFPGKLGPIVALWFILLVGGATTFAVLHAQDEEKAKAAENTRASEENEEAEAGAPEPGAEGEGGQEASGESAKKPQAAAKGPGETLQLEASPTEIAYSTIELTSKPGRVTIDFENPAAIEHDVAIEQDGKEIAKSEVITEGKTSVSADLAPGTYTFLCTVPGHAEAGMEGTLTVR